MDPGSVAAPRRSDGDDHVAGDPRRPVVHPRVRHDVFEELEVDGDRGHRRHSDGLHRHRPAPEAPGRPSEALRGPGPDAHCRSTDRRVVPVGPHGVVVRRRRMHPPEGQARRDRRRGIRLPRRAVEDLSRGALADRRDRRSDGRDPVRLRHDVSRRTPVPSRPRGPTVTRRPTRRTASVSRPWRRTSWGPLRSGRPR